MSIFSVLRSHAICNPFSSFSLLYNSVCVHVSVGMKIQKGKYSRMILLHYLLSLTEYT